MNQDPEAGTSSLERLIPDSLDPDDATGMATFQLHLERYGFAAAHAQPGRVLDCACGVGYGTRRLLEADSIQAAVGVDLSADAIATARERYAHPDARFEISDALQYRSLDQFDTVVSLETIEHVPDPQALVAHLVSLLRPGGVFVGSVPTTPSMDANPYHLHDFTEASFRALLAANGLKEFASFPQEQPFNPLRVATRQEKRTQDLRQDLLGYYLQNPGKLWLRFWSTVVDGFRNKYLTIAARKAA